ncbi:MAG: histidinol-phosphatase [Actinomycetales bacterium]|nr:histidinol-phosphatase [Actinomycetales bacterium]
MIDPADDLALALTLAGEADLIAFDRYRAQDLEVQHKADLTEVTDADRRIEREIRDRLSAARPGDGVLGEEFGEQAGTGASAGRTWIVDPIDGTSNFVRGIPNWGLLLALAVDGEPIVGVVSAPALGRRWWAAPGHGAWVQEHGGPPRRIRVSAVPRLAEASISYNSLKGWDDAGRSEQLLTLSRTVARTRAYGDLWSYMLVAEGALEAAGEFDLKPWDIAALVPIVREAGGRTSDFGGGSDLRSGGLLASNGLLHDALLAVVGDGSAR